MNWNDFNDELVKELQEMKIPEGPFKLDKATTITNPRGFVNAHISICKGFKGNTLYLPYLERLIRFRDLMRKK